MQKTGYPYTGRFRQYRYWVDISKDGGPWIRMGVNEGWTETGKALAGSFAYEVPEASVNYRVRIQDAFDPDIVAISEAFHAVLPDVNASVVQMKWDWSYGNPERYRNVTLHGVAADGAARIFLEVSNPNLSQASVLLTDPEFPNTFDSRFMGKVMAASVTDQYSEEANTATNFIDVSAATNGKAVFWYIAPDDFARSIADNFLKERIIRAVIQMDYLNGDSETKTLDIRIVRPPLMMVHGLGGDESAWDIFSKYLTEDIWTVTQPVRMNPTASFDFNASNMVLNDNKSIPEDAHAYYPCFPFVIEQMRQKGFAANRVDYLAHSMGGAVFRNVLTNFREAYYRNGASAEWQYKNYGKGYANKVITIGTPHKGSILADIIDRFIDDLPKVLEIAFDQYYSVDQDGILFNFIEKKQDGYQVTPAVKDLQVSGGKLFSLADVRAHLIGGDYFEGEAQSSSSSLIDQSTLDYLEDRENTLEFVHLLLKEAIRTETDLYLRTNLLEINEEVKKNRRILLFLQRMADYMNVKSFIEDSDLVVHLESQFSSLGRYNPMVTTIDRVVHSPPLDLLPAIKELASEKIIDTTFKLLNIPVGSKKFGPIPATTNFKTNIPPPTVAAKSANSPCAVSVLWRDTAKIRILSPSAPVVTYVDSTLTVQIAVFDTTGMNWADVYFQGRAYTLPANFIGTYQLDIAAGVNSLDSQEVVLLAYYTRNDSCIGVVEKVAVRVLRSEPLLSFEAFPAVHYLFPGQTVLPGFRATFPNGNSGEFYFSPSIAVQVADPAIVTHQTGSPRFLGVAPGTTYAVLSYGGFQDTVYFVVMPELKDLPSLPPPVASFGFTETTGCAGAEVHFENNSVYADSYFWEFGDGETSADQHPVHLYQQPGYHQAFLTVTQSQTGHTARYSVAIEVELPPGCNKTISGNLYWMGDGVEGVSQAQVTLSGDVNGTSGPTSSSGLYTFDIPAGSSVTLTPWKNINLLNGVDAADASAIQQHLVNILPISDFFRLVAADVNKSFSVSTLDALVIRQALLGNPAAISVLNKTKSWRFVPTDYVYPNPAGPFSLPVFPESRNISAASDHVPFQDFYGVKVGDVVETVNAADPANKSVQQIEPLVWEVQDQWLESGKTLAAEFSAMPFDNMAAFQFALQFDPAVLRFEGVEVLAPDLPLDSASNFGAFHAADGELRIVWSVAEGVTLTQIKSVFRLHFTVMKPGKRLSEVMRLAPEVLTPAAFSAALAPGEVQLLFSENMVSAFAPTGSGLQLYQNRPNPFSEGTIIGFKLPEACDAQLRIVDAQGREVLKIARAFQAGYHEEAIYMNEFGSGGIFYYELTTPVGRLVRKMTVIGR
ncbi:MAG: PKD domain-containing protein [Thermoanaerobaculia bacterium]|nr:PKD domain-containing protein [Thermoanaerobaculia bacterium]